MRLCKKHGRESGVLRFFYISKFQIMYVEFRAYPTHNGEWDMNPETEGKVNELLPHVDEYITASSMSGEDEKGEYMCYCYGEDYFYAEDGTTELDGDERNAAENENHADVLSAYIALYPLVGKEIIDLWINDGSQFGRRPLLETAQSELDGISILLS